jgi:hypothetical protein
MKPNRSPSAWAAAGIASCFLALLLLAGCKGIPTADEKAARRDLNTVADAYRPAGRRPQLPALQPDAGLSNYLEYALLNSPRVESAYYQWVASAASIKTA